VLLLLKSFYSPAPPIPLSKSEFGIAGKQDPLQVSRYISGLLLSENKTVQGIYAQQVDGEGERVTRRAMHAAVFEAGWDSQELMTEHRQLVGKQQHQGKGREIISLDWTLSHHEYGLEICGQHTQKVFAPCQYAVAMVRSNSFGLLLKLAENLTREGIKDD
jgi:hypothetical protein